MLEGPFENFFSVLRRKSREYTNGTEIAGGREKIV